MIVRLIHLLDLLDTLIKYGLPQGDLLEFSAVTIQKYEKKLKHDKQKFLQERIKQRELHARGIVEHEEKKDKHNEKDKESKHGKDKDKKKKKNNSDSDDDKKRGKSGKKKKGKDSDSDDDKK